MFQTEVNAFFQEMNHPWWALFMQGVSEFGTLSVLLFFILFFLFAVDFRKGFIALQGLFWANIITLWLKELITYPRPWQVDEGLSVFQSVGDQLRLTKGGAESFFSALPKESILELRAGGYTDFGVPSGHTSLAVSYWGTLAILFKKKWLTVFTVSLVLLTIISRIYLAQHFLADVLAGLIIGLIPLLFVYKWLATKGFPDFWTRLDIRRNGQWALFFLAPAALLFVPDMPVVTIGPFMGLNLGVWLVCRKGFPDSANVWWKRTLRLGLAIVLFILSNILMGKLIPEAQNFHVQLLKPMAEMAITIGMATWLNLKLGLFRATLQ
jgi:membrane-associated phospholipid phosphatase